MEKLSILTAVAAPLAADNLDTDQIMPKQFLRGIDKSGLARGTFYNMRFQADGTPNADCVLNRPGFEATQILVCGPNFGCGSSREHAVWGLQQIGVRVVIAPSFGEIFYSNCFNNGLLAVRVTPKVAAELFARVSDSTPVSLTVDLVNRRITLGDESWPFMIGDRHRTMILEGLDMLQTTLCDMDAIKAFQAEHEARFPWMAKLAGRAKRALPDTIRFDR